MIEKPVSNIREKQKSDLQDHSEVECVWPQILAILAGALAAFTDGAIYAWTSPFIVKIVQDTENYNISETEASRLTVIQPVTMIFTCAFVSKFCDVIGRKKMLLILSIPQILSLIFSAIATNIYVFYTARVFAGLANGFLWSAMPMYIGEVASPKVRGVWGNALTSAILLGQFAINVVGSYFDVATSSYIFLPIPILFFAVFTLMPESPYYCLMKNNYEAAKTSLRFLTRKQNVDYNFSVLKKDVERQMSESGTWKDLIIIESNRKALLAAFFLRFSQQFTGMSVLTQYTQFVFQKFGGNVSPQVASMIYSGLCIFLNILVIMFIMNRFSRKVLYTTSLALSSVVLLVISTYFYLNEIMPDIDISFLDWLPITAIISYQVVTSFGLVVIPSLMLGELFSASIKSKALTVMMVTMASGVFITATIFNFLNTFVGSYAPFLLFMICTAVSTILSLYLVPETKGKTLEEIQMSLKAKK